MNDFTASNGVTIEKGPEGHLLLPSGVIGIGEDSQQALREFFQAEADERLGRWRWPENPDYVVYIEDGYAVVVDEAGPKKTPDRIARRHLEDPVGSIGWGEFAARAYFDAHPEPKPWHDAKPGEVWILDASEFSGPHVVEESGVFGGGVGFTSVPGARRGPGLKAPIIQGARRIWPEVPS